MPSESQIFPEFPADDPQDFAAGSRIPQDFPRKSEALAHHPPPAPRRPGACSTKACDPLNPRACPSEAYPGDLMPGYIPDHSPIHTQVICVRIRLALNSQMKSLPRSIPLPEPGLPPWNLRPFLAPMPFSSCRQFVWHLRLCATGAPAFATSQSHSLSFSCFAVLLRFLRPSVAPFWPAQLQLTF